MGTNDMLKELYREDIKEEKRLRKFIEDLDQILQDNVDCMVDDHGNPISHDVTEDTVYGWIMDNDEYHLLGKDWVKRTIHLFMTDFQTRMAILRAFSLT